MNNDIVPNPKFRISGEVKDSTLFNTAHNSFLLNTTTLVASSFFSTSLTSWVVECGGAILLSPQITEEAQQVEEVY